MPQAHDIGKKYYWHLMRQEKTAPLFLKTFTQEIEPPFRKGSANVFRVPFMQHTLVVGTWVSRLSETDALMTAIMGHEMDYEGLEWD